VDDRHSDPLIDDVFAREIEDALDVEPSPAFVTRVLANKPARRSWAVSWTFAVGVSAAAAAIVTVVLVTPARSPSTPAPVVSPVIAALPPVVPVPVVPAGPREETRMASAPAVAATPVAPAAPVALRPERVVPVVARVQPNEPEVLFAKDETAALQRLTRGIARGVVDPETLSQPGTTTVATIQSGPIVLPPLQEMSVITLEPLGSLVEGARQ
jgi:hypothetical protein